MTPRKAVEQNTNTTVLEERRKNRSDRRVRGERRGGIDLKYAGKVRRMTIERRLCTDSRRAI